MDEWTAAVQRELGLDLPVDVDLILDVARVAAHNVARPAAPVTTFLLGVAAAGGADLDGCHATDRGLAVGLDAARVTSGQRQPAHQVAARCPAPGHHGEPVGRGQSPRSIPDPMWSAGTHSPSTRVHGTSRVRSPREATCPDSRQVASDPSDRPARASMTGGPRVMRATMAACGFPGRPISRCPSGHRPRTIGEPGRTSTPSTSIAPPVAVSTSRTKSTGPLAVPPVVTTRSASEAPRNAAACASRVSETQSTATTSQPMRPSHAGTWPPRLSRTLPSRAGPSRRSSSPMTRTCARGRRMTTTSSCPAAAARPTCAGPSVVPASMSTSSASASAPAGLMSWRATHLTVQPALSIDPAVLRAEDPGGPGG